MKTYIISFLISALIGLPITLYGVSTQDKAYKMPVKCETVKGTPVETTASIEDVRTGGVVEVELYDVPLDEELQLYIIDLCEQHHIAPAFVFAVIEQESQFNADAVGDDGKSMGLMQIYQKYHQDRMEKLGCGDLMNPYDNVAVGIDYLYELFLKYECPELVLCAYNAGITGAERLYFSKGIYSSEYSKGVMEKCQRIEETH